MKHVILFNSFSELPPPTKINIPHNQRHIFSFLHVLTSISLSLFSTPEPPSLHGLFSSRSSNISTLSPHRLHPPHCQEARWLISSSYWIGTRGGWQERKGWAECRRPGMCVNGNSGGLGHLQSMLGFILAAFSHVWTFRNDYKLKMKLSAWKVFITGKHVNKSKT